MNNICIDDEIFCYKKGDKPELYHMTIIVQEIKKSKTGIWSFYGIFQGYSEGQISVPYKHKMHAWVGTDTDHIFKNEFDLGI